MVYRYDEFAPGNVYHIYTRGVEERNIFQDNTDRKRFLDLLTHCLPQGLLRSYSAARRFQKYPLRLRRGEGIVDLLCYCLMTNHFHLLLHENVPGGISHYMHRLLNSYAKYFNKRQKRVGSLFVRPFQAVWVDDDDQLLHVSRYIHLNPYVAHMVENPMAYAWSSLAEYIGSRTRSQFCHVALLREMMKREEYKRFVTNEKDYARRLGDIKHLLLDNDHGKP